MQMVTFLQLNIQLKIFNIFKKGKFASLNKKQAKIFLQNQNKYNLDKYNQVT